MKCISDLKDLKGKKVILRLDLNMPIDENGVTNSFRLDSSLETINFLKEQGAKTIIISHIENKINNSLGVIEEELKKHIDFVFCKDIFSNETKEIINNMQDGDFALFENLRNWDGEKSNDEGFTKELSSYADIYVNEAFSVSHREHASVIGLPKFLDSYFGIRFKKEVEELSRATNPEKPFVFILGGVKFQTKLPLINKFKDIADTLIVGGALANDIYKAKRYNVGQSLVSDIDVSEYAENPIIEVPDFIIVNGGEVKNIDSVNPEEKILDAAPEGLREFRELILSANTIVWNGPLGDYENGYSKGTEEMANMIAKSSAYSIVGGGDTLAAIDSLGIKDEINFISTGGGAMLDFLANETLPGIEAIKS